MLDAYAKSGARPIAEIGIIRQAISRIRDAESRISDPRLNQERTMRIWHQSFTDLTMVPLYRRTLVEHASRAVDAGTEVVVHGLRPGTYGRDFVPIDAIRHRYLESLNELQVCEAVLTAEREGYNAVALGCFFDPALRQARSLVDIPVVSLLETCMLLAC